MRLIEAGHTWMAAHADATEVSPGLAAQGFFSDFGSAIDGAFNFLFGRKLLQAAAGKATDPARPILERIMWNSNVPCIISWHMYVLRVCSTSAYLGLLVPQCNVMATGECCYIHRIAA